MSIREPTAPPERRLSRIDRAKSKTLGQPMVIINQASAAGTIGAAEKKIALE